MARRGEAGIEQKSNTPSLHLLSTRVLSTVFFTAWNRPSKAAVQVLKSREILLISTSDRQCPHPAESRTTTLQRKLCQGFESSLGGNTMMHYLEN